MTFHEFYQMVNVLFLLIAGHFLMDVVLQQPKTMKWKRPGSELDYPEGDRQTIWPYELFGHAVSHGLIIKLLTGSLTFALIETVFHFTIDYCKSTNRFHKSYSIHIDQFLHISCKICYVICFWRQGWLDF